MTQRVICLALACYWQATWAEPEHRAWWLALGHFLGRAAIAARLTDLLSVREDKQ